MGTSVQCYKKPREGGRGGSRTLYVGLVEWEIYRKNPGTPEIAVVFKCFIEEFFPTCRGNSLLYSFLFRFCFTQRKSGRIKLRRKYFPFSYRLSVGGIIT